MFQIVLFIYNDNSLNMKLRICTLIAVSCAALSGTAQNEKLTEYVNPLVGTDGYGNVYPGAQIPFGGIQISPGYRMLNIMMRLPVINITTLLSWALA